MICSPTSLVVILVYLLIDCHVNCLQELQARIAEIAAKKNFVGQRVPAPYVMLAKQVDLLTRQLSPPIMVHLVLHISLVDSSNVTLWKSISEIRQLSRKGN